MSTSAVLQRSCTIGGKAFKQQTTLQGPSSIVKEISVNKAFMATLTVRTDNFDGTLTFPATNPLTAGQFVDIYSTASAGGTVTRRCLVGTIAGLNAPITAGVGGSLPALSSQVIVAPVINSVFQFTGSSLIAFAMSTDFYGVIDPLTSVPASCLAVGTFVSGAAILDTNVEFDWFNDNGTPNPLASAVVASCNFSHADVNLAHNMRIGCLLNY